MSEISAQAQLQLLIRQKESELEFWENQATQNTGPNVIFMRIQIENVKASLIGLRLAFNTWGDTDV